MSRFTRWLIAVAAVAIPFTIFAYDIGDYFYYSLLAPEPVQRVKAIEATINEAEAEMRHIV